MISQKSKKGPKKHIYNSLQAYFSSFSQVSPKLTFHAVEVVFCRPKFFYELFAFHLVLPRRRVIFSVIFVVMRLVFGLLNM